MQGNAVVDSESQAHDRVPAAAQHCHVCGYDLHTLASDTPYRCPECGSTFTRETLIRAYQAYQPPGYRTLRTVVIGCIGAILVILAAMLLLGVILIGLSSALR